MAKHNIKKWLKEVNHSADGYAEENAFVHKQGKRQTKALKKALPALYAILTVAGIEHKKLKIINDGANSHWGEWVLVKINDRLDFNVGIWSGQEEEKDFLWEDTDNAGAIYYYFYHSGELDDGSGKGEETIGVSFDLGDCLAEFLKWWYMKAKNY